MCALLNSVAVEGGPNKEVKGYHTPRHRRTLVINTMILRILDSSSFFLVYYKNRTNDDDDK